MPWTIYCHTHVESGRRYVGLTKKTWQKRWIQHCAQAKSSKGGRWHFPNAIRKYGKDAFSHEILEVLTDLEVANLAEECWIELLETRDPAKGFNLAKGGSHVPNHESSSISMKAKWADPEYRVRAMAASKAGLNTLESKARRSIASTQLWSDPVMKEKLSAAILESHSRPEVRVRLSAAQSGKTLSTEHRAKISASSRCQDPDVRTRISEATKEAMARPEVKAKTVGANIGRKTSDEVRAKISAAGTGRVLSDETRKKISESMKSKLSSADGKMCKVHGFVPKSECDVTRAHIGVRLRCRRCRIEARCRRRVRREVVDDLPANAVRFAGRFVRGGCVQMNGIAEGSVTAF